MTSEMDVDLFELQFINKIQKYIKCILRDLLVDSCNVVLELLRSLSIIGGHEGVMTQ